MRGKRHLRFVEFTIAVWILWNPLDAKANVALQNTATNVQPAASSMWLPWLGLTTAVLGLAAAFMLFRNERWKKRLIDAESRNSMLTQRVDQLVRFCRTVYSTSYVDIDFIFLGPRGHGKTSIVTALTRQWKSIQDIRPTPIDFTQTSWELPHFREEAFDDEDLGVTRTRRVRQRIVVYDYAGEDQSIAAAMDRITSATRSVVLFVMSAEPSPPTQSSSYFNLNTVKKMRKALAQASSDTCTAFILLSKHDLSTFPSIVDPTEIPEALLESHSHALENIKTIFGTVPIYLVSAETGYGITYCVRDLLRHVFSVTGEIPE